MSSKNSTALASLTATYTDSENEDRDSDDDEITSPRTDGSSESTVSIINILNLTNIYLCITNFNIIFYRLQQFNNNLIHLLKVKI